MGNTFKLFDKCTLCGGSLLHTLKGYESCFLAKCANCSFVFVQRIPDERELIEHYSRYPRSFDVSAITLKRYNQLLDTFENFRRSNRILDVGAGNCLFLIEARKRGWQAHGTDFGKSAVDIGEANGIAMRQGKFSAAWYPQDYFDIVTSFETIEHINTPNEEITNIKTVLRAGGGIYLTTPNFNSLERRVMKINYNAIEYPEHLSYYSKRTMNYLLRRHGFRKATLQTTGISFTRLKTSLQLKNKKPMSELFISKDSMDEKIRNSMETKWYAMMLKFIVNKILTLTGTGNSLKALYIKN